MKFKNFLILLTSLMPLLAAESSIIEREGLEIQDSITAVKNITNKLLIDKTSLSNSDRGLFSKLLLGTGIIVALKSPEFEEISGFANFGLKIAFITLIPELARIRFQKNKGFYLSKEEDEEDIILNRTAIVFRKKDAELKKFAYELSHKVSDWNKIPAKTRSYYKTMCCNKLELLAINGFPELKGDSFRSAELANFSTSRNAIVIELLEAVKALS